MLPGEIYRRISHQTHLQLLLEILFPHCREYYQFRYHHQMKEIHLSLHRSCLDIISEMKMRRKRGRNNQNYVSIVFSLVNTCCTGGWIVIFVYIVTRRRNFRYNIFSFYKYSPKLFDIDCSSRESAGNTNDSNRVIFSDIICILGVSATSGKRGFILDITIN